MNIKLFTQGGAQHERRVRLAKASSDVTFDRSYVIEL